LKCLLEGGKPQPIIRLVPHLIFRSNLSLFSSQIAHSDDEFETELQQS
jgi:LacI family transcriptional regulator